MQHNATRLCGIMVTQYAACCKHVMRHNGVAFCSINEKPFMEITNFMHHKKDDFFLLNIKSLFKFCSLILLVLFLG